MLMYSRPERILHWFPGRGDCEHDSSLYPPNALQLSDMTRAVLHRKPFGEGALRYAFHVFTDDERQFCKDHFQSRHGPKRQPGPEPPTRKKKATPESQTNPEADSLP